MSDEAYLTSRIDTLNVRLQKENRKRVHKDIVSEFRGELTEIEERLIIKQTEIQGLKGMIR